MSNPYAPTESPDVVWEERAIFIGDTLSLVGYRIMLVLFFQTAILLAKPKNSKQRLPVATYTLLMFTLGTIFVFIALHTLQQGLIDNRNYPDGPIPSEELGVARGGWRAALRSIRRGEPSSLELTKQSREESSSFNDFTASRMNAIV
ncbi:hypothetical protein HWV62_6293 [Athelia sp. TMB]|nr:hypothetical protein HWV62_6293 [Athelia sp. TMB]